jgi:hypothetical protein
MLFIPCMPAVIHYQETKLGIKQLYVVKKSSRTDLSASIQCAETDLSKYQKKILEWHSIRADFRANENVGEHFVQLVLLLLIKLLQGLN